MTENASLRPEHTLRVHPSENEEVMTLSRTERKSLNRLPSKLDCLLIISSQAKTSGICFALTWKSILDLRHT
jgi:hypothetical protein